MIIRGGRLPRSRSAARSRSSALLHATAAGAEEFGILYHERLGEWSIAPDTEI